jgi:hypothetical protein
MSQAPEPGAREFLTLEDLFQGVDATATATSTDPTDPAATVLPDADPPVPELI